MKSERIVCAAVKCKLGGNNRGSGAVNIIAGVRHAECMAIVRTLGGANVRINSDQQGFLTNNNKFVDRKQAYRIAIDAVQIEDKGKGYLISEDLY